MAVFVLTAVRTPNPTTFSYLGGEVVKIQGSSYFINSAILFILRLFNCVLSVAEVI
jgi:hypothetical protein